MMAEERDITFIIKCVVKSYHACHYSVEDDEAFVARRKGESVETLFKLSISVANLAICKLSWVLFSGL